MSNSSRWVIPVLAMLLLPQTPAWAGQATLTVTASRKAGPARPTWKVSRRVQADISEDNLEEGTEPTTRIRDWVQNDVGCSNPIDDAGHYIAKSLGGTGSDHQNIFPEDRTLNRGRQSTWEKTVKDYVINECTEARVTVSVSFSDSENPDTRPVSVTYEVRCVGTVQPNGRASLPTQRWTNTKTSPCR